MHYWYHIYHYTLSASFICIYKGCLLDFEIREQIQILRSIHFCMRLNQLSKHFCQSDWGICKICILNASTASSGDEKRWPLTFFTYGNKKKSFDAKARLYGGWLIKSMFWVLKNAIFWAAVWELALSCWSVLEDNWQTNGCEPLRIDCFALF